MLNTLKFPKYLFLFIQLIYITILIDKYSKNYSKRIFIITYPNIDYALNSM